MQPERLFDHLRLCRLALRRLRYLCFDIFFRRFLISEPMNEYLKNSWENS